MKAIIEIEMDNAAFEDENNTYEVCRILRKLAAKLELGGELMEDCDETLRDINGNNVGYFRVEGD